MENYEIKNILIHSQNQHLQNQINVIVDKNIHHERSALCFLMLTTA